MPGTHPKWKPCSYTNEQLQSVIEAVKKGVSYREAAASFNVPKATLFDKAKGRSEARIV